MKKQQGLYFCRWAATTAGLTGTVRKQLRTNTADYKPGFYGYRLVEHSSPAQNPR